MSKVLISFVLLAGSLSAQVFAPGTHAAALTGPGTAKTFVLPGDQILPQVANAELDGGQQFFTLFQAVNVSGGPATFQVNLLDPMGDPMEMPIMQDGATVDTDTIADAIAPGGVRFAQTVPDGSDNSMSSIT